MTKADIHCAVYTRKSSEEGLEQSFNSLEAQREACVAYIDSQKHEGWVLVKDHYDDGGFSGGSMERPGLKRILDDISAGKVQTVIVYKVDRLTRSLADFAKIVEVFDSHNASFVSVTQQFNTTTSMGRLTLNVLLSFAQFERELTGERIRDKVAASKKKGMWMGGMVPLGYDCVGRRLIINPSEAETVRELFRQYLRLGSVAKVKEHLEQKGVRSKVRTSSEGRTYGGAVYSRGALHQILNNRIYIGKVIHQGEAYKGQHDPILAQALWDQVAARLKSNDQARRTKGRGATTSLLTGLLQGTDGVRYTPTHAVKGGKRYRYYTSQAVIQGCADRSEIARFPARELEALVATQIHHLLEALSDYLPEDEATPEAELAAHRAEQIATRWESMGIGGQQRLIRTLVKAVAVGRKNLWIEVDKAKLMTMMLGENQTALSAPARGASGVIKLTADFQTLRRRAELRVFSPAGERASDALEPSLIKAVARARIWYEQLMSGEANSVKQLAQKSGFKSRYVRKILQSAVLSPNVIEAILAGKQAPQVTVKSLQTDVPLNWNQQATAFLARQ